VRQVSCPAVLYNLLVKKFMEKVSSKEWWPVECGLDWPAPKDATFERIVGAVLVQNATWHNNASRAIQNLKNLGILEPLRLFKSDFEMLKDAIRPAGCMGRKLKVLREIAQLVTMMNMNRMDIHSLRQVLLNVDGIGPETSDVILLYACNRPVIPISTPAMRILERFCGLEAKDYVGWQTYVENNLPKDVRTYRTFHALLVEFGLNFCTKIRPKCEVCIIKEYCNYRS